MRGSCFLMILIFTIRKLRKINVEKIGVVAEYDFNVDHILDLYPSYQKDGSIVFLVRLSEGTQLYRFTGDELSHIEIPDADIGYDWMYYNDVTYVLAEVDNRHSVISIYDSNIDITYLDELTGEKEIMSIRFVVKPFLVVLVENYEGDRVGYSICYEPGKLVSRPANVVGLYTYSSLLQSFNHSPHLIIEDGNQVGLMNMNNEKDRDKELLQLDLYYPAVYYLSPDEVIVIGQREIHDSTSVTGKILDGKGNIVYEFPDQVLALEDYKRKIVHRDLEIQKVEGAYMISSQDMVHYFIESKNYTYEPSLYQAKLQEKLTEAQATLEQLEKEGSKASFKKQVYIYTSTGEGWIVLGYLAVFILVFGGIYFYEVLNEKNYKKRIEKAFANGGKKIRANVRKVEMTGVTLNELPQVKLTVESRWEDKMTRVKYKTYIFPYAPITEDSSVDVVYDSVKKKVIGSA